MIPKRIDEDWRFFNEAVRRKALGAVPPTEEQLAAPPLPPPPPAKSDFNLVRALLVLTVVLVALAAVAVLTRVKWPTSLPNLWPSAAPAPADDRTEAVVTNYTTFNRVAFHDWSVVTGWNFARSGDTVPTYQYCYLEISNPAGKETYSVEDRPPGVRRRRPDALIQGLDEQTWAEVGQRCRWVK